MMITMTVTTMTTTIITIITIIIIIIITICSWIVISMPNITFFIFFFFFCFCFFFFLKKYNKSLVELTSAYISSSFTVVTDYSLLDQSCPAFEESFSTRDLCTCLLKFTYINYETHVHIHINFIHFNCVEMKRKDTRGYPYLGNPPAARCY